MFKFLLGGAVVAVCIWLCNRFPLRDGIATLAFQRGLTMKYLPLAALALGVTAAPLPSFGMDSMTTAMELGSVLASEEACSLTFDQAAIERFIEGNVAPDDMGFASTLQMMTEGTRYQIGSMSISAKTAHCSQIRRVARANGFIAD